MDGGAFLLGLVSSLAVGGVLGWFGHVLAARQSKEERKVVGAIEVLDRCAEVFNARVKYVIAYNRKAPGYREMREDYADVKRRFRYADPEVLLVGTDAWNAWMTAERAAREDLDVPLDKRIKTVEATSYAVLDALAARRLMARG